MILYLVTPAKSLLPGKGTESQGWTSLGAITLPVTGHQHQTDFLPGGMRERESEREKEEGREGGRDAGREGGRKLFTE